MKWVAPKANTPSSHEGTDKEIGDEYGLTQAAAYLFITESQFGGSNPSLTAFESKKNRYKYSFLVKNCFIYLYSKTNKIWNNKL